MVALDDASADAERARVAGFLSKVMVDALLVYPHANARSQASLLTLARALPVVAAADAPTRDAFRPAIAPILAATGLVDGDFVRVAAREAFDFACDGAARVKLKRVLDDFAWIAARGARTERDWRAMVALRGLLAKSSGNLGTETGGAPTSGRDPE